MAIVFNVDGERFRFGDLTLGELAELERQLGVSWGAITPAGNAAHAQAVLSSFMRRANLDQDMAVSRAAALSLNEFLDLIEFDADEDEDSDADPKAMKSA